VPGRHARCGRLHFGLYIHLAKAISFVLGTTTAYLLNRRWTFQAAGGGKQFASVFGLYALTFAVQLGVNALVLTFVPESFWGTTDRLRHRAGDGNCDQLHRATHGDLSNIVTAGCLVRHRKMSVSFAGPQRC